MWEIIQANKRKSMLLIIGLAVVLMLMGYAIGFSLEPGGGGSLGVIIAMGIWMIMMLTNLAGGEKILMSSAGAREVTHDDAPQLYNIVEEMKIAAGLPAMPKVYIIDSPVPNAFAVGLKPERAAVAVTTGLLGRLNRDELQGVIAHELGHISNRDTLFMTWAGVTVGAVILMADLYLRGMIYGGGRNRRSKSEGQAAAIMAIIALVLAILAPIMAQLLYFACSRRREYLADASSAQFTRYPEGLASALEKISAAQGPELKVSRAVAPMFIVNPLAAHGSAASLFSTHPPTEDRVRVLRSMSGGSSLAAYEEAYRASHKNESIVGARNLESSSEQGIRQATETAAAPFLPLQAQQWREAKDIVHRLNQDLIIPCPCGIRFKIPADFEKPSFDCPKCGTHHEIKSPKSR
jgi:heat shock protein HtpX